MSLLCLLFLLLIFAFFKVLSLQFFKRFAFNLAIRCHCGLMEKFLIFLLTQVRHIDLGLLGLLRLLCTLCQIRFRPFLSVQFLGISPHLLLLFLGLLRIRLCARSRLRHSARCRRLCCRFLFRLRHTLSLNLVRPRSLSRLSISRPRRRRLSLLRAQLANLVLVHSHGTLFIQLLWLRFCLHVFLQRGDILALAHNAGVERHLLGRDVDVLGVRGVALGLGGVVDVVGAWGAQLD